MYRTGNRLFMIMETNDSFSFEKKSQMDESNHRVQDWETLMWKYQQALPGAKPGEKWVLMDQIFSL
jgi:L-rhamnose mutarotase